MPISMVLFCCQICANLYFLLISVIGHHAVPVKKANLVKRLQTWGPEFCIYFEVFIKSFSPGAWHSLIHFTTGGNAGKPGSRYPGVWVGKSGNLLFVLDEAGKIKNEGQVAGFKTNHWHKISIVQKKEVSYLFSNKPKGLKVAKEDQMSIGLMVNRPHCR